LRPFTAKKGVTTAPVFVTADVYKEKIHPQASNLGDAALLKAGRIGKYARPFPAEGFFI
jgi:hypothetical protein